MATHNPKQGRPTCRPTLEYIYRGDGHEHDVKKIKHLGGNLFSPNPIRLDKSGNLMDIELDTIEKELNKQSLLHKGKGEMFFKHYVISLAPGEIITPSQWLEMVTNYMQDLGYDNSTKWVAVEHADSTCRHVHILSCLVKNDYGGTLVKTNNDYEKGWACMRKFENKFNLRKLINPSENFGHNYTKAELKGHHSRLGALQNDDAAIIRARFKNLYENDGKPKTMTALVKGLAKRGVAVKLSLDKNNEIQGINYSLGHGKWISGSKIKKTRFTWTALQKTEGISYDSQRDNPALGLDEGSYDNSIEIMIMIKLKDEFHLKYLSILKFEIDIQGEKAYMRLKYEGDMERLAEFIIQFILMVLSIIFRINLMVRGFADEDLMKDFELMYNPEKSIGNTQPLTISAGNTLDKKVKGIYKKMFGEQGAGEAEFEPILQLPNLPKINEVKTDAPCP